MDSYDDAGTRNRLRKLTDDPIPDDHLDRMMGAVMQRAERNDRMKRTYRRTGAIVGGAVLLLVALLVIPISHSVCVGSVVTAELPVPTLAQGVDLEKRIDEISGALSRGEGVSLTKVGVKDSVLVAHVGFHELDAGEAGDRVQALLKELGCTMHEVNLATRNVVRSVGGNALASVASIFIRVKISGLSEEEISAAIEEELSEYGEFESVVEIRTEGDEQVVDITIEGECTEEMEEGEEKTITIELVGEDD